MILLAAHAQACAHPQEAIHSPGTASWPVSLMGWPRGHGSLLSRTPPPAEEEEEAWVDTALCTSCDECTRKLPQVFAYNANKQAYVKDPKGAPFKEIVAAAELCTAKIIHPGTPWNPAEADLASSLERAKALATR